MNKTRGRWGASLSGAPSSEKDLASWYKQQLYDKMPVTRKEMLLLINDHPNCTFDFISRHFTSISPQTVHYHLAQLQTHWFIYKRGVTRGAVYVSA